MTVQLMPHYRNAHFGTTANRTESAAIARPVSFLGKSDPPEKQADRKLQQANDLLGWLVNQAYLPNKPLSEVEFTVLDLETTGLDRSDRGTEIIELTGIKYRNGVEIGKFSTLVRPEGDIPENIQELTGITPEMAAQGLNQKQALKAFAEFVGSYPILVAHNASYDIPFLRSKLHQNGLEQWKERFDLNRTLCTQTLARVALPKLDGYPERGKGTYTGSTVAQHLGITNPGAHRAENDVKTTALTLYALIKRLQEGANVTGNPMRTLRDLFSLQGPVVPIYAKPLPQTGTEGMIDVVMGKLTEAKTLLDKLKPKTE